MMLCPKCGGTDTKKVGSNRGKKRAFCYDCSYRFVYADSSAPEEREPQNPRTPDGGAALPPSRITEDPPALPEGAALPEGGTLPIVLSIAPTTAPDYGLIAPRGAVGFMDQGKLDILFLGFMQRFIRALYVAGVKPMIISCAAGIDPDTIEDIVHTLAPEELPLAVKNSNYEQLFGFDMPQIDKTKGTIIDSSYVMAKRNEELRLAGKIPANNTDEGRLALVPPIFVQSWCDDPYNIK